MGTEGKGEQFVTRLGTETIVAGGEDRFRKEKEREIREELVERLRGELERSGAVKGLLVRAKIELETRRVARRLSERGWYLKA